MTKTTIHSNGSKWGGDLPDSIESLFARLKANPLDPTFEEYGDFVTQEVDGSTRFFGNFFNYSHVFRIDSTDTELVDRLTAAIRDNQQTVEYADARNAVAERKRQEAEYKARKDAEWAESRKYR